MRKVIIDRSEGLLVQVGEGGPGFIDLDNQVINAVATKFGQVTLEEINDKYGPLREFQPVTDYTGWKHFIGCVICPNPACQEYISTEDDITSILATIQTHVCRPRNSAICACDDADTPHNHLKENQ
jgi:hypothetical protein